MPRVVIRFDERGEMNVVSDGGEVDLLFIDERCPRDRVYLHGSHSVPDGVIDALIDGCRIGRLGDMPGAEAAVRAFRDGEPAPKPALQVVHNSPQENASE